jgi:hypothetical protein
MTELCWMGRVTILIEEISFNLFNLRVLETSFRRPSNFLAFKTFGLNGERY